MAGASSLVPTRRDLPGYGWRVVAPPSGPGDGADDELLDCVGPDFPSGDEVLDSASSAHFVRGRQLVHGLAVEFVGEEQAARAAAILDRAAFAHCLGRSVAADLAAEPRGSELLAVDVAPGGPPHRVSFAGAGSAGVLTVHLDVVVLSRWRAVSLLWFGDAPEPFPVGERDLVTAAVSARLAGGDAGRS